MDAMKHWRRACTKAQTVSEISRGAYQEPIDNSTANTRIQPPSGPPSRQPLSPPGSPSQGAGYHDNDSTMSSQPYQYNTFGPAQSVPAMTSGSTQYYSSQSLPMSYEPGPSGQHVLAQYNQNSSAQHQPYAILSNHGQQIQGSPPLNAQPSQIPQQLPAPLPHRYSDDTAHPQGYGSPSPLQYPQRSHTLPGSFNLRCRHDSVYWDSQQSYCRACHAGNQQYAT